MRWREASAFTIRSEEVASVYAEIVTATEWPRPHRLHVWSVREGVRWRREESFTTLDVAKDEALKQMREQVIAARGEAENTVLDASRWLRANGGEP